MYEKLATDPSVPTAFSTLSGQVMKILFGMIFSVPVIMLLLESQTSNNIQIFLTMSPSISVAGDFVAAVRVAVLVLEPVLVPVQY